MPNPAPPIETDALIVGAGPVGLFQVFQLGLLDIRAQVVDSLPHPGGQCVELYADKPIYDIPGIPVCTGQELTDRLLLQIEPMRAGMHFSQEVTALQRQPDDRFLVSTSRGTQFLAKTVFIAAGVGAFQPRRLKVQGIDKYEGTQLLYGLHDPAQVAGKHLVVTGDEDAALEAAIAACEQGPHRAASVSLLHRRDVFRAAPETIARMRALCEAGHMRLVIGQITGLRETAGRLAALEVTGPDALTQPRPLDLLVAHLGLSPKLGPVADWGLALERKQLVVDTETCSTSERGIFAVGDINTYPGKKKLILCGFHECVMAAFGAAPIVHPDRKIQLQYTTTSPRLHALLGVASPAAPDA